MTRNYTAKTRKERGVKKYCCHLWRQQQHQHQHQQTSIFYNKLAHMKAQCPLILQNLESRKSRFQFIKWWLKLSCDSRFQREFTECCWVFKVITLVWANQGNYFENANARWKRLSQLSLKVVFQKCKIPSEQKLKLQCKINLTVAQCTSYRKSTKFRFAKFLGWHLLLHFSF